MPRHLRTDLFSLVAGVPLGSDPGAGVLLRVPHGALPTAARRGPAAVQRDAQCQQRCCRGVLPGLPDPGARYGPAAPAPPAARGNTCLTAALPTAHGQRENSPCLNPHLTVTPINISPNPNSLLLSCTAPPLRKIMVLQMKRKQNLRSQTQGTGARTPPEHTPAC